MTINPDDSKQLQDSVLLAVRGGFDSRETIIETEIDNWRDDWQGDDYSFDVWKRHIAYTVDVLMKRHYTEQQTWLHETDCDKLDEAFAELDRCGIVARQNFSCCQSCGHTEIQDEILEAQDYRPIQGYVFFHQQDTEHATDNDRLYLAYGGAIEGEIHALEVAQEVVATLRKAGLTVEWNGLIHKRIAVKMTWQRRRLPEYVLKLDKSA